MQAPKRLLLAAVVFSASVAAVAGSLPGDADGDGRVDLTDFVILKNTFGSNPLADPRADFDADGDVDLADFVVLKQNFGRVDVVVRSTVAQPTEIPGDWVLHPTPMPDLQEIVAGAEHNPLVAGLYAWGVSYGFDRADAQQVGFKALRAAGDYTDAYVTSFVEDDLDVMATLAIRENGSGTNRSDYATDEAFLVAYLNTIETFLNRYGPGGSFFADNPHLPYRPIRLVELWNEPNFQYMLPNDENLPRLEIEALREQLYAKVLVWAYPFIKANWPEVRVVGFAAGGSASADVRFIENVLAAEPMAPYSFDVVSTHPYSQPNPPESYSVRPWGEYSILANYATIRDVLDSYGRADAPIWYTEVGWKISEADGGTFPDSPGEVYVSPELQAAYVTRMYATAMRLGVERVNIMYIRDSDGFNGGFFENWGPWRPSAYAAQTFIDLMPNPKLAGAISDGDDGRWILRIAPDADAGGQTPPEIIMAWKVQGPEVVEIDCGADTVTVTDLLGAEQIVPTVAGRLRVEIGPLPLYIRPAG